MKKLNRKGEKHVTNEGYTIEIIEYYNANNCTIQFENGYKKQNAEYIRIKKGIYCNPFHKRVHGFGYMGHGKYKSCGSRLDFKRYHTWQGMLSRCYNKNQKNNNPTYKDIIVCDEWHNFQEFAKWFDDNYNHDTMDGWHLDKDILFKGNKIYSPHTCSFVPATINNMFVSNRSGRGELCIGVKMNRKKYIARCWTSEGHYHSKSVNTEIEAFNIYKSKKEFEIKNRAEQFKGIISSKCYTALINYKVEFDD